MVAPRRAFTHQAGKDHDGGARQCPGTGPKLPDRRIKYQREDQGSEFQRRQPCCAINAEGNR